MSALCAPPTRPRRQHVGDTCCFLIMMRFVRPDALVNALAALSSASDVGVVGGRLLLPSGLVQEAGSIVWSDGSTLGYSRGAKPEAGEVMFRRDVHYCSGALLLTRVLYGKNSADLMKRTLPLTMKTPITVCAFASVACGWYMNHPWSQTITNMVATERGDAVNLMLINRQRFRTRFAEALQRNHLTASAANILIGRDHGNSDRRRLLVIDNEVPFEALGSGYPRMRRLLKEATKAGSVSLVLPVAAPHRGFAGNLV